MAEPRGALLDSHARLRRGGLDEYRLGPLRVGEPRRPGRDRAAGATLLKLELPEKYGLVLGGRALWSLGRQRPRRVPPDLLWMCASTTAVRDR